MSDFSLLDALLSPTYNHITFPMLLTRVFGVDVLSLARTTKTARKWATSMDANAHIKRSTRREMVDIISDVLSIEDYVCSHAQAEEVFQYMMEHPRGLCFSGSSVMQAVSGVRWKGSDIDVFGITPLPTPPQCIEPFEEVKKAYKTTMKQTSHPLSDYTYITTRKELTNVSKYNGTMVVSKIRPRRNPESLENVDKMGRREKAVAEDAIPGIDFVMFKKNTLEPAYIEAFDHFDLPFCRCAIDHEKGVVLRGVEELVWRRATIDRKDYERIMNSRFLGLYNESCMGELGLWLDERMKTTFPLFMLNQRIAKYRKRGFEITAWHETRTDDTELPSAFEKTHVLRNECA
jgi:hypothetical protein